MTRLATLTALVLLTACSADQGASAEGPPLPWARVAFPEVSAPADNAMTEAKAVLGRLLFYDPIFSSDRQVACATCHSELWGMGDGLPRSVGIGGGSLTGPGRTGPNLTRRNAQTIWNVAFRKTLFWDGRASSLEDQVHFPFDATIELGRSMSDVVLDLRAIPGYVSLFQAAFPDEAEPITTTTLARALASFERTVISKHAPYDHYAAGDPGALTAEMLRGMQLFAEEGCATCHAPPLFSSERFEDRGIAPVPGVDDAGRFEVTGDEADRNRFKVPTLRNAHDTGPFFHTGAASSLDEAVHQEVSFAASHGEGRQLTTEELSDLSAFLMKGLFDPSQDPIRPYEVPSGLPVPLDGFDVRR